MCCWYLNFVIRYYKCPSAEIGRQASLRGWCTMCVGVRVPSWAQFFSNGIYEKFIPTPGGKSLLAQFPFECQRVGKLFRHFNPHKITIFFCTESSFGSVLNNHRKFVFFKIKKPKLLEIEKPRSLFPVSGLVFYLV